MAVTDESEIWDDLGNWIMLVGVLFHYAAIYIVTDAQISKSDLILSLCRVYDLIRQNRVISPKKHFFFPQLFS